MSERDTLPNLLAAAEHAAAAGDLAAADARLKDIARIQEAELGPDHPDLANTLNNLAVVAEQSGRTDDAEACYRRAVAIASKALPADDPTVAACRQNLEDFCRARGIPIERPVVVEIPVETVAPPAPAPAVIAREPELLEAKPPASRSLVPVVIGIVVLAVLVLLVMRPWSSGDAARPTAPVATTPPAAALPPATAPPSAEPPAPPPAATAPAEPAPPVEQPRPAQPSQPAEPAPAPSARPTPPKSSGAVTLATAELCKSLSTGGQAWRCDPADDPARPGPLVLYTRVRSPRDDVVVHRWFRGDALRQSVTLKVRANPSEGYRTYSRQSVDGGGEWRVEVTDAAGNVLHERRIAVR